MSTRKPQPVAVKYAVADAVAKTYQRFDASTTDGTRRAICFDLYNNAVLLTSSGKEHKICEYFNEDDTQHVVRLIMRRLDQPVVCQQGTPAPVEVAK